MQIEILNVSSNRSSLANPSTVYIGRAMPGIAASPLANPFKIGKGCNRNQACDRYLTEVLDPAMDAQSGPIWDELVKLAKRVRAGESINLACWCAPQRCHGFDIAAAIKFLAPHQQVVAVGHPVKPWREVGTPRFKHCDHPEQIPGLDAVGCPVCQEWFVDQAMRDVLCPPKTKRVSPHTRCNRRGSYCHR